MNPEKPLKRQELADALNISLSSVDRRIADGRFKPYYEDDGIKRYLLSEVVAHNKRKRMQLVG